MKQEEEPKSPKRNKPAENVGSTAYLNFDLIVEILIRLPIRFFLYFKSVSKEWLSLITNPQVIRRHQTPDHNPAVGLFLPTINNNDPFEYLPFFAENPALRKIKDPNSPLIRILSSCNGLLLCERETRDFVVYNPTTNQLSTAIPRLPENIVGMSLAFDPAKSPDHYKVVMVHRVDVLVEGVREHYFKIKIYSSKKPHAWRSSGAMLMAYVDFSNGVYWNNAIHWISLSGADSFYFNIPDRLLEKMPTLPLSQIYHDGPRNYYFGESCDHLHYIQIYKPDFQFDIYEMKRDYSEWSVKYHVDLSRLLSVNPLVTHCERVQTYGRGYSYKFNILSVVRGDQEEEEEDASFLVLRIFRKVIRYNMVSKTSEMLHEYENMALSANFGRYQRVNAFQYIESLCNV